MPGEPLIDGSEAPRGSKDPARGPFALHLDHLHAKALPVLAPVLVAFFVRASHRPVRIRVETAAGGESALLVIPPDPRFAAGAGVDASPFLQALLDLLVSTDQLGEPAPLPSFPALIENRPPEFLLPAPSLDLDLGRRTIITADVEGKSLRWTLQRALLKCFAAVETQLERSLPDAQFDRLWNLTHGGLPLPIDPPPVVTAALPPESAPQHSDPSNDPTAPARATPPPTTPPPTTPPPTTPPPTTPPPTTPPPTTPPPTTPPPTTPPPTTPPPTTPPPTTQPPTGPRIRFFAIDGHLADTHKSLAGEAVRFAWQVEGRPPLRIELLRDGSPIATRLRPLHSRSFPDPQSGTYTLRASNKVGVVTHDLVLKVAPKPTDPTDTPPTFVGVRDLFGPSTAVVHPAAVAPGEGYFNVDIPAAGGIPALTRGWRARLFYPGASSGPDAPFGSINPLPVVFYAPGRLHNADSPNNYRGVTFLADHLAARGYIFISIDLSQVDDFSTPNISQRETLFRLAIDHLLAENANPSSSYHRWFDLNQLVIGGHSRGGETAALYARNNRRLPAPQRLPIRALFAFSPTDAEQIDHIDEPLLLLYGTYDGDNLLGQPLNFFSRSTSWKKKVIVSGANHFNWTDHNTYAPDLANISRAQCHTFARGFVSAFLDFFCGRAEGHEFTLTRHKGIGDVDGIPYFGEFHDPRQLLLHDFESPYANVSPNNLGQPVTTSGGSFNKRSFPIIAQAHIVNYRTVSLLARAPSGSPQIEERLAPHLNYAEFTHLAVRAFQDHSDPLNAPDQTQDFSLELEDAASQTARVPVSDDYAVPPTDLPSIGIAQLFVKCFFFSYRISLGDFLNANRRLDLSRLQIVRLVFDRTPTSAIIIDDLRFTY